MASLNRIFLIGNLTRDPELRYIPSGQAVATMRMAVTERYRTKAGENREETLFIDVIVWGKSGENCAQYLKKGSGAFVEGRLRIREFEGRDGTKQRRTEVTAMRVQFLARSGRAGGGGGEEAPPVDAGGGEQVEEPLPPLEEDGGQ